MSNKDVFKELYSKYLNKEKNYNKILENIEKDKIGMNKYLKWSFIPICLIVVICGLMVFRNNNNSLVLLENEDKPYIDENNNVILNINNVTEEKELAKIDGEVISNYYYIPYYEVLSNLKIPEDFDDKEYNNVISIKNNQNYYDTSIYSKDYYLMQYQKILKNSSNNRSITISYSEKNEPLRDYHFEDGKVSKINDFELIIYKYENSYMTSFKYKNLNIDIETSDITEEEFVSLLLSIIK